jgi:hypothetical protein
MGLSAFQRRRELSGAGSGADQQAGKMQGREEAKLKDEAAKVIAQGGLPNPADAEKSVPSTPQLEGETKPSREAEEEWLSKHGVSGDDPPKSTEPGGESPPIPPYPEPSLQVDKEGDSLVGVARKEARSPAPPTVMGAAEGQEPKDRAFTQEEPGTIGKVTGIDKAREEADEAKAQGGKTGEAKAQDAKATDEPKSATSAKSATVGESKPAAKADEGGASKSTKSSEGSSGSRSTKSGDEKKS